MQFQVGIHFINRQAVCGRKAIVLCVLVFTLSIWFPYVRLSSPEVVQEVGKLLDLCCYLFRLIHSWWREGQKDSLRGVTPRDAKGSLGSVLLGLYTYWKLRFGEPVKWHCHIKLLRTFLALSDSTLPGLSIVS